MGTAFRTPPPSYWHARLPPAPPPSTQLMLPVSLRDAAAALLKDAADVRGKQSPPVSCMLQETIDVEGGMNKVRQLCKSTLRQGSGVERARLFH